MKIEKIKPIPKYIITAIKKADKRINPTPYCYVRFYSYFTKNDGELVKITAAVRHRYNKWYIKQVAVHGLHSDICFVKDMEYNYYGTMGFRVGWHEQGLSPHPKWYEQGWQVAKDKYYSPFAPVINREFAYKFPQFKYSAVTRYEYSDVLQYLRVYEQYPQAEMLVKFGLSQYATSKQILRKIGEDKSFRKWLITHRQDVLTKYVYCETLLSAYKTNKPIRDVQRFLERKKKFIAEKDYAPIRKLFKGKMLERFFKYADDKQVNFRSYLDYLNACEHLQIDMTEDKNRFPHDFKRWHDIRIDEYTAAKLKADAKERAEFYKRFLSVADKYLSLQLTDTSGFAVVIAKSPAELIREGNLLHHCVGRMGYDQKFVREETLIFFIRKVSDLNNPFVTMEYSLKTKKILQCYGDNDLPPSENVLDFINKVWLPKANKQLKKLEKAA